MGDFMATTASSNPQVNSAEPVEAVLARYYLNPDLNVGVNYDRDTGEPYLFLYGFTWPEAWQIPEGVRAEDFDPCEEGVFEHGAEGFIQLLEELAPHLKEPLTVQAVGSTRCFFPLSACEWHIAPGAGEVEVHEFRFGHVESVAS